MKTFLEYLTEAKDTFQFEVDNTELKCIKQSDMSSVTLTPTKIFALNGDGDPIKMSGKDMMPYIKSYFSYKYHESRHNARIPTFVYDILVKTFKPDACQEFCKVFVSAKFGIECDDLLRLIKAPKDYSIDDCVKHGLLKEFGTDDCLYNPKGKDTLLYKLSDPDARSV